MRNINNAIYEEQGHAWWNEDAGFELSSLRYMMNPCRYGYFADVLRGLSLPGKRVLDVGCGGGFLSEEFARDGYEVVGVDPATNSVEAARKHAREQNLGIDYRVGQGESLPFHEGSFDIVACCDVLEHVDDVENVIGEASRVLIRNGVFLFDTVNRTFKSKLVLIKVWQDWGLVASAIKDAHVWEKFIKPSELTSILHAHSLELREVKGLSPAKSPIGILCTMLKLRNGVIHGPAIGKELPLQVTNDLSISYIGWAVRA